MAATARSTQGLTEFNLAFLTDLLRQFPSWAIWLPQQGQWTAVRPRQGTQPSKEEALVWVQAPSARKLCEELKRAERRLQSEAPAPAGELTQTDEPQ